MTTTTTATDYEITFTVNDRGNPPGKLADAEVHFTGGVFAGMKLIGFSIWEQRQRPDSLNVTFPARTYSVNGERRSFALLRPAGDPLNSSLESSHRVRDLIVAAWKARQQ